MKVSVIGAGAVGLLMAGLLKESGCEVLLITRRAEQAAAIRASGMTKDGSTIWVDATDDLSQAQHADLVMIAVKYSGIETVLETLRTFPEELPLVFLQNGMLHVEKAKALPQLHILAGSVEHGARKEGETAVRHTGHGTVKFALLKGEPGPFSSVRNLRSFPCEWHPDADRLLFRKVLLNAMINPLTAILNRTNGELLTVPDARRLLEDLYAELFSAFPFMEELLPFAEVEALCRTTADNTSSMLADRLNGRKMELDTIVLYALKRSGRPMPVLRTLYHLLKATEED